MTKETLKKVRAVKDAYKKGTRIIMVEMDDIYNPIQQGEVGTVVGVDDIGQIMMKWDNGSRLSIVPDVDKFEII